MTFEVDAAVVCVDDTRRNVRRLRELGCEPVLGRRCAGCRCAVVVDPHTVAFEASTRLALLCIRCARVASEPDTMLEAEVPGTDEVVPREFIEEVLQRPMHELLAVVARNTMGAQG